MPPERASAMLRSFSLGRPRGWFAPTARCLGVGFFIGSESEGRVDVWGRTDSGQARIAGLGPFAVRSRRYSRCRLPRLQRFSANHELAGETRRFPALTLRRVGLYCALCRLHATRHALRMNFFEAQSTLPADKPARLALQRLAPEPLPSRNVSDPARPSAPGARAPEQFVCHT